MTTATQPTFMLLLRGGVSNRDLSPEQFQRQIERYMSWIEKLRRDGHFVAGEPLEETGKVLSAKRYADLLLASARRIGEEVVLTLPDGTEHEAGDPGIHATLSGWLDHEVRLEAPPVDGVGTMVRPSAAK